MSNVTRTYFANEGESYTLNLVSERNLQGSTITARMRLVGATGTGSQVASVSGGASGTLIALPLDVSTFSGGRYELEVYSDYGTSSRILLAPMPREVLYVILTDRFGVGSIISTFDSTFDSTFS